MRFVPHRILPGSALRQRLGDALCQTFGVKRLSQIARVLMLDDIRQSADIECHHWSAAVWQGTFYEPKRLGFTDTSICITLIQQRIQECQP